MSKFKYNMKKIIALLSIFLIMASCQTKVVTNRMPLKDNTLQLYKTYNIQSEGSKTVKVEILKIDNENIYGKLKNGENITLDRKEIIQIRKPDPLSSLLIGAAAVAAVVFVPM